MSELPFPWSSDRPLSDETARQLIESQFPRLAPVRVTARAQGWDNEAVEVNGEWMFRFPKRADAAPDVERELRLLARLAPRLPLPVPRYEFFGRATREFPYAFAGYRKLAGVPATHVEAIEAETVAAQLGEMLSALHAIAPEEVEDLHLPPSDDDPRAYLPETLRELEAVAPHLPPEMENICRAFLERDRHAFASPLPRRLLHDDLRDEHLLLAPDGSRIQGIIDWTDASVGDPAHDFAGLWSWQGEAFAARVFASYAHSIDAHFWARVRFYGLCCIISTLHYALQIGDERTAQSELEALRRALT